MKMRMALLMTMVIVGGCGGETTESGCTDGATQPCVCTDGTTSSQTCSDGAWSQCTCEGCQDGQSQDCTCDDGSAGTQTCSNGAWDACECSAGCQDGQVQACLCPDGSASTQTCTGGVWGDCQCAGCQNGQTQVCTCPDGAQGVQTCSAGAWGTCQCAACVDGQTQACTCSDGTQGTQACTGGAWGNCQGCSRCADGQTQACSCPDGSSGTQTCSGGDWGDCEGCTGGLPDFSGIMGVWIRTTSKSDSIIGEVTSTTDIWARAEVAQDGGHVVSTSTVCGVAMNSDPDTITISVPDAFINSLEEMTHEVFLEDAGGGMINFTSPENIDTRGWHPNDPATDELPTEPDDPRVYDQDNDGQPGLTVQVSGLVSCDAYIVMRDISSAEGSVPNTEEVDSLTAYVTFSGEMWILDATNALCKMQNGAETYQDPVAENSFIKFSRIDPSWACSEVLANKDTLFQ